MKYVFTICIALVVLGASALLYAWSGIYNIAATQPHWSSTLAFIDMVKERSVEKRSAGVRAPDLDDPALRDSAFPHFHEMCRLCHGAPGSAPSEFAEGFYPSPPSMTGGHIQSEMDDAEVYWVIKNGIKMTGMPAFGPTHDDGVLWGLTALVKEMPRMKPDQYHQQVEAMAGGQSTGHAHMHGNGEPEADGHHGHSDDMDHDAHAD